MEVLYNGSGIPQVFYDQHHDPILLPPRFAYTFDGLNKADAKVLSPHSSLRSLIDKAKSVLFVRNYALGDLLMLLPVLREFREAHPGVRIILATTYDFTNNYFVRHFCHGVVDVLHPNYQNVTGYDLGILLDDIVERDHRCKDYSEKHRVDIYRECLCLPTGVAPKWGDEPTWVGLHGVVFCSGGKKPIKQLPEETTKYFLTRLKRRKFRNFVHIREGLIMPSPAEFVETLRNARVLITMDTAPLWLAHYTRTPVVFISGPTRGTERISYHPLYPDGAKEVSFSKAIGCTPCFEGKAECIFNPKCFDTVPKERMWQMVEQTMEEVMWTN